MRIPSLRFHRASKQGRVTLSGKTLYCGPWGSGAVDGSEPACPACQERYRQHVAAWLAGGAGRVVTIARVVAEFMDFARSSYPAGSGSHGGESTNYKYALRCLEWTVDVGSRQIYLPNLPADEFTVTVLEAVRAAMRIQARPYRRKYANRTVKRIQFAFKWAARRRLVKQSTYQDLCLIEPLRRGVPGWGDRGPVRSVPLDHLQAVLPRLSSQTRAIAELCLHTGMRVGEVLSMRTGAINTSTDPWIFDLGYGHKTGHHGHDKQVELNAEAQRILKPWLSKDLAAKIFTHKRSSIRKAIVETCDRLGIPRWTTHRLRHSAGTKTFKQKMEALNAVKQQLGQSSNSAARTYVDPDVLTG